MNQDDTELYDIKYLEFDRISLSKYFKKYFYFPKSNFIKEEGDYLNFGFLIAKIFLLESLIYFEYPNVVEQTREIYSVDIGIMSSSDNLMLEELFTNKLLEDLGISSDSRIEVAEAHSLLPTENIGNISNATAVVILEESKEEQSKADSPTKDTISLSLEEFKPDDNSDGAAIRIIQNPEKSDSRGFIFDWIDVINVSWTRSYLLSLKVIQDMQQAIADMYSKIEGVKQNNYKAMFKPDDIQNPEIKYMEDLELTRSAGLNIFLHAESVPLLNLNGEMNLFGPIY